MFFTKLIFDERFYFDTLDTQYSHVFLREGYVYPVLILKLIYMAFMLSVHLGTFYCFFCLF